jgi:hypothetical protein
VEDSCEQNDEPSSSVNGGEFLDHFLKDDSSLLKKSVEFTLTKYILT